MAASGIRCTMFFQSGRLGFSETHVNVSTADLATLKVNATNLYKLRMKLNGYGVLPVGVRLSKEGVFRDSLIIGLADIGDTAPGSVTFGGSGQFAATNATDQAKACVLIRADASAIARKSIYMCGVPDLLIGENSPLPNFGKVPNWLTDFNNYKNYLIANGWGFISRVAPTGAFAPRTISGLTVDLGTGLIGIITTDAGAPFNANDKIQLRGIKRNNPGIKQLNGLWVIASVLTNSPTTGQQTYFLANSATYTFTNYQVSGTIQAVDRQTATYIDLQVMGITTRKRGNRFLAGPGRRKGVPQGLI